MGTRSLKIFPRLHVLARKAIVAFKRTHRRSKEISRYITWFLEMTVDQHIRQARRFPGHHHWFLGQNMSQVTITP
ncbi:hypothetical protein XENTR_v10018822 [Xenopus tropicalis]|nr:hypothetical protein XENTR_v10018822 [Xenopus tropicalis]